MATRFAKAVAARVGSAAVLGGGVRAARGAITAVGKRLPELVPPLEFPSRIEPIAAGSSSIDNDVYDDDTVGSSWHSDDPTDQLATLQLLNTARIPYFDRVWRQQLGLPPGRPGAYLEVGCGGGIATVALASLGYQMTGIDPAARALDEARAHARARGLADRTVFAAGDAYDLSAFPDDSFDGVLMADVMEHLLDLPAAVAEVRRVLKPGGVLVFDTINRTYKSYLAAIVLAEEVLQLVPPRANGFLVDTAQFRGMAPTVELDPRKLLRSAARALPSGKLPPPPLSHFVEVSSLDVNYLGWAQLAPLSSGGAAGPTLQSDMQRFRRSATT
ncbi:3-demethylubiquinone-9 3-methyltransferase [Emiliania huxleyi CCMP1516]|uniref:Methyltransferase type 11 domain-containing protein n=2 Tax=Emiliania huxleyi TaxID=2903 RepID=A0A0D3ILA9_EMIH1|nr:3-demethylubiquinone-9 3-methyltransferase [Emiliania huxleyi CCMP1516]EOD12044.1 3-demethylubiquinone-9 3-methyltransferase [Emiliania huxleyi CCMP1516]|eukprot:XP_005764473.1 3-demethylubiquinone-9 3-methyltransferase [Emiliania huxleyi CCMP1516]